MNQQPIDIRPNDLATVRQILCDALTTNVKVWVFGSRATWTTKDSSDLDLAIDAGRPLTRQENTALADAFDESSLPYKVDVVDMHNVSDTFKAIIERDMAELKWGNGWKELNLSYIAEIVMGQSPSSSTCNLEGFGLPLLNGPSEFGDSYPSPVQHTIDSRKISEINDILFCVRGSTAGRMNWSNRIYAIGRGLAAIRHKNGSCYKHFLRGILDSNLKYLLKSATGSTFPNISRDQLLNLKIFVPPLHEQKAIASMLGVLDDKINLNRQTCKTLEAMAQALFKSWFVDFDPVRAKMEGCKPYGMDATTAALFPNSLVESELGLIPKGWGVKSLDIAYDINPTRKLKKGERAPYLDMANVPTTGHHPNIVIGREMASGSKFINGDTLLARITPCLENGKTAFVDFLNEDQVGWGSTEFVVLRPKAPLPAYHGYLLARHNLFREFAIQSMSGTSGRQRIQNDALGRYLLAIPTCPIAEAFGSIITSLQKKMTDISTQSKTLENIRDYLLPKLISGEVRIL